MPSPSVVHCVETLISHKLKIAFVESATAGRFASEFSLVKQSGDILLGGLVTYDASVKTDVLKIPAFLIEQHTAESAEVTKAMAENMRTIFKSDVILAVTGLASPGGSETPEKPVGTMFLHILMPHGYLAHREVFEGTPEEVVLKVIDRACKLITDQIQNSSEIYNLQENV